VGVKTKILYGIGEIAITMKMVLFGLFILFFYNTVMGLPAVWVGVASAVGLVVDAVSDPYVGYLSDASKSRYGRRHSFMLVGALTMGVCFWMIWAPRAECPRSASSSGSFSVSLFGHEHILSSLSQPGAELSDDYHERTAIVGFGPSSGSGCSWRRVSPSTCSSPAGRARGPESTPSSPTRAIRDWGSPSAPP
jgi:Na+/melibiose symporter-like transporter